VASTARTASAPTWSDISAGGGSQLWLLPAIAVCALAAAGGLALVLRRSSGLG
jgi:hypothetical protein